MSIIAINMNRLSLPRKFERSSEIANLSTNNESVPGNATLVASLTAAITAAKEASAAYDEARQSLKGLMAARDAAVNVMNNSVTALAGFTQSVTGGSAEKILTTGFDVRAEPGLPQPVEQILSVKVSFTGEPGKSLVTWKRDPNADAYRIQCSLDPMTATSWKDLGTVVGESFEGNGATPGMVCWYRVAGVNALGQGTWSEPALRPVM